MAQVTTGQQLACALLRAFGINPQRVRGFTLSFDAGGVATLDVKYYLDQGQADAALEKDVTGLLDERCRAFVARRLVEEGAAQIVLDPAIVEAPPLVAMPPTPEALEEFREATQQAAEALSAFAREGARNAQERIGALLEASRRAAEPAPPARCSACGGDCPEGWPHHLSFDGDTRKAAPYTIEEAGREGR